MLKADVFLRAFGYDAFENNVDPTTPEGAEELACGYTAGHNIVVCPVALPGGSRGFGNLADAKPTAGSSLECSKNTWGAMFVHELSHTFGAFDYGTPYGYGFEAAKRIATDAGNSANGKGTNGATPMANADTWSLFSLGKMAPSSFRSLLKTIADRSVLRCLL